MNESTGRNIRLGTMVLAGLALLVSTLYIIGKNSNWFGSHYSLRARFGNVNGLMPGNNVRFSGLQAGTVSSIRLLNDTTVEVVLSIDAAMQPYINKNALAAIGTEGLIGNKVVNIIPVAARAPVAAEGDLLAAQKAVSTDQLLETLDRTNRNLAEITDGLKVTVARVNGSTGLWKLLGDGSIPANVRVSLAHLRQTTVEAEEMMGGLEAVVSDLRSGKGSVGRLLVDTGFSAELSAAVAKVREAGQQLGLAGERVGDAGKAAEGLATSARTVVQDSALQARLQASMENIRKGTEAFSEDMEALKHNFLLRGYFRRQEKAARKKQEEAAKREAAATGRTGP